ncbi:MAG: hypothetical protein KZQ76_14825 [Candidatus Thiodiazotropha sp. (ex Epidulcina cf. delphinae)]|nr:hypothetical protein [Candidatus Thiodiazotropha sp. (ex Epidulcina cf. delphinae)]
MLVVEESSTLSGGAVLIKEFVNATVAGQPGIYAIKKSKSGKTYAMLNWTTSNFAYTLYQIDSLDSAKEILTFIGDELTQINYQENETSDEALSEDKVAPSVKTIPAENK